MATLTEAGDTIRCGQSLLVNMVAAVGSLIIGRWQRQSPGQAGSK